MLPSGDPTFQKVGSPPGSMVLKRSEHVQACSANFSVLNIEHVNFHVLHVQKYGIVFGYVPHVQHV